MKDPVIAKIIADTRIVLADLWVSVFGTAARPSTNDAAAATTGLPLAVNARAAQCAQRSGCEPTLDGVRK